MTLTSKKTIFLLEIDKIFMSNKPIVNTLIINYLML